MLEQELAEFKPPRDTLLTIGVFDGVHLGHKHLISRLVEEARKADLMPGVLTFQQHPEEIVSPQKTLPFLTSLEERVELLKQEGAAFVAVISFTPEVVRTTARQFLGLLQKHLRMRGLVVGPDFALGKDRKGEIAVLAQYGREMGFTVTVVPPALVDGEVASSTAIRKALAVGDVTKAERLIGRPFRLHGNVVSGAGRGRRVLGFPTANIDTNSHQALPTDGVYAVLARVDEATYPALANVGTCPTFGGTERGVEVYILGYSGDLYGHRLVVDFIERLREEKRFGNAEELKSQMEEDVRRGREILQHRKEAWKAKQPR